MHGGVADQRRVAERRVESRPQHDLRGALQVVVFNAVKELGLQFGDGRARAGERVRVVLLFPFDLLLVYFDFSFSKF